MCILRLTTSNKHHKWFVAIAFYTYEPIMKNKPTLNVMHQATMHYLLATAC